MKKTEVLEEITQSDIKNNNDIEMIIEKLPMMGKGEPTFRK